MVRLRVLKIAFGNLLRIDNLNGIRANQRPKSFDVLQQCLRISIDRYEAHAPLAFVAQHRLRSCPHPIEQLLDAIELLSSAVY